MIFLILEVLLCPSQYDCYFSFTAVDPRKFEKIQNLESMMPTTQDPERFSFWVISFFYVSCILRSIIILPTINVHLVAACYPNKSETWWKIRATSRKRYKRGNVSFSVHVNFTSILHCRWGKWVLPATLMSFFENMQFTFIP